MFIHFWIHRHHYRYSIDLLLKQSFNSLRKDLLTDFEKKLNFDIFLNMNVYLKILLENKVFDWLICINRFKHDSLSCRRKNENRRCCWNNRRRRNKNRICKTRRCWHCKNREYEKTIFSDDQIIEHVSCFSNDWSRDRSSCSSIWRIHWLDKKNVLTVWTLSVAISKNAIFTNVMNDVRKNDALKKKTTKIIIVTFALHNRFFVIEFKSNRQQSFESYNKYVFERKMFAISEYNKNWNKNRNNLT